MRRWRRRGGAEMRDVAFELLQTVELAIGTLTMTQDMMAVLICAARGERPEGVSPNDVAEMVGEIERWVRFDLGMVLAKAPAEVTRLRNALLSAD